CEVCNKPVAVDDYGNGLCENCGWEQDKTQFLHPDTVQYPNMMSLNKAKALYKAHKPLLPSIEDFAEALFMYGEMEFKYNGELFEVSFENEDIMLASKNEYQTFKTKRDFIENATIKGTKLKDLWKDVKNAYYML
ncbi:MAG: hypothetical protein IJT25_01575, partial [Clostridia bacterium]|nr:hypothetical protein [Clostridia bacterium]